MLSVYGPSLLCGVKSDLLWVNWYYCGGQKCYMCIHVVERAQECKLVSGLHEKVLVSVSSSLGQVGVRNQKPCMHCYS